MANVLKVELNNYMCSPVPPVSRIFTFWGTLRALKEAPDLPTHATLGHYSPLGHSSSTFASMA